jgi:rhamnogalacturonan endolyase
LFIKDQKQMRRSRQQQIYARRRRSLGRFIESLEDRTLMAFGLTTSTNSYTVDTGANLVFSVARTTANSAAPGDLTSTKYNGTELEAPFSATGRYSHYESGLTNATVTATVDPQGNWIMITCNDTESGGVGVIQYYIARKGFNNIYMATYAPGPSSPAPGEMRFITYTNHSILVNAPAPSNLTGNSGAIEGANGGDVFGFADGTTASKYYGEHRAIDAQNYGLTGGGFGVFMDIGNRESSSGGPFFKDIDYQTTSSQSTELYTYMFSGHSQTENFRPGLQGPYALEFTTGGSPAAVDYSFIDGLNLMGSVPASGRGTLSGTASGVPSGFQITVALSNATAQYWGTPDVSTGAYTISGVKPGTYTETLYQGELAVGTQTVTIVAGATTRENITDTNYTPPEIFRIGTFDGTPIGFLNADKIQDMHPSDSRMTAWADSTGITNYTVGTTPDTAWPMAEWKFEPTTGPSNDTDNRITFNLTADQAATPLTLRIAITRADHGRPNISVNGGSFGTAPALSTQPDSRGVTVGNWRGNNTLYTYNISTSSLHAGTNTIDIVCASGSPTAGNWLSPYFIYDAMDLVATSNVTNAPHVANIVVTPANQNVLQNAQEQYSASATDQFGNPVAANFTWSSTVGSVDGTGLFISPSSTTSGTVTAISGGISGNTSVAVVVPLQISTATFQYDSAQMVSLTFNRDVDPAMLASALSLQNLTTQTTISPSLIHVAESGGVATITFTGILADGNYQLTVNSATTLNAAGDQLASSFNMPPFFVLAGDANHDRTVNLLDLNEVVTNFGQSGKTFTQGNFDYSGTVGIADFNLLAGNFGKTLAAPPSSSPVVESLASPEPTSVGTNNSLFSGVPVGPDLLGLLDPRSQVI